MRSRPVLLAACACALLGVHLGPAASLPPYQLAAAPAAYAYAYAGPTSDWHAELRAAIQSGLDEQQRQLVRFYEEAARQQEAERLAAEQKAAARPARPAARAAAPSGGGSHRGYATARECVSMVEHGGSYDESRNPSHKGRFQFSRSAWISFGGIAEHWDDWTLASPGEQDAVFETAWSQGPAVQQQQWLRWDGCGPPDGS